MRKKLLILIILSFFITGCDNYHELNELGIVSSILFDYHDNQFYSTIEVVDDEEYITYEGHGNTISNTLDNALIGSEKYLYYAHLNAIILTDQVPIDVVLEYFLRDPSSNNTFYICITEDTDLYNKDENIGLTLKNILKRVYKDNFFDTVKKLLDKNTDFVLPILDKDKKMTELYVYKDNKIVDRFNNNELNTIKLLHGYDDVLIKNGKEEYIELKINKVKRDFKIKDKIEINLELEATIEQITSNELANNIDNLIDIQNRYNLEIENNIKEIIKKIKTNKADILSLNNMILNKVHNLDKKFYDYDFYIKVNTHINKKGLLLE